VDKSATGSVNFFWSALLARIARVHLRSPAMDHGVVAFLWAVVFGLFIWIGGSAVGYGSAVCFIVGCVAGFLIFLFVRVYGEDEPRRP
jgi:hypothetical protein